MTSESVGLDLRGVVRRRWRAFVLAAAPLALAGVAVALLLPAVYQAKATVLVEKQQIPEAYVQSTISGYVDERLQAMSQQILSRPKLLDIAQRFDLYPEMRDRYTTGEILDHMRESIRVETISADVIDRRTGRPSEATIAFSVSYQGRSPGTVQKVTSVLASLYLDENLRQRETEAASTTDFLSSEAATLKAQIDGLETRISRFKQTHLGELPEYTAANLQTIERLQRDVDRQETELRTLEERRIYLEGQLAGVDEFLPVVEKVTQRQASPDTDPSTRLSALKLQLTAVQTRLSGLHPDVVRLKKEVAELEAQLGPAAIDPEAARAHREQRVAQRADLAGRLGPEHPDVVALDRELAALQATPLAVPAPPVAATEKPTPSPAYITLQTQITSTRMELDSRRREREETRAKLVEYQKRVERSPTVEREYANLARDYETAKRKYTEIQSKVMEAQVAQGLESSQRGERFTLVEPAQVPERPFKPNRKAIVLIALVLALGAGVGLAAARESLDRSVRSPEELYGLGGVPVLAVLPLVETDHERRTRRWRTAVLGMTGCAACGAALLLVHHYLMPLDILWFKVQGKVGKVMPL